MKRKTTLILSSLALLGGVGITTPLIVSCSNTQERKIYMKNYIVFNKKDTAFIDGKERFRYYLYESKIPIEASKARELIRNGKNEENNLFLISNAYFDLEYYGVIENNTKIFYDNKEYYCFDYNML